MGNCISLRIGSRKTSKYMVNEFYSDNKESKTVVNDSSNESKKDRRISAHDSFNAEKFDNNQNVSAVADFDFNRECESSIQEKYLRHKNEDSVICTPLNQAHFEISETETLSSQCDPGEIQPMPTPLLSNAPFTPGRQMEQFYNINGKPRRSQEVREYIQRKRLAARNNIVEE